MPGVTYTEKKQGKIRVTEAVFLMASALIPLGNYVTERDNNHDGVAEIIEHFLLNA